MTKHKTRKASQVKAKAVRFELPEGPEGPIHLRIDFSLLNPPEKYFYATAFSLSFDRKLAMCNWRFGAATDSKMWDLVDIVMPFGSLATFARSLGTVRSTLQAQVPQIADVNQVPGGVTGSQRSVRLYANFAYLAVGQGETNLDFYYVPPRDIHLAKTMGMEITALPVVRIMLASVTTKQLVDEILAKSASYLRDDERLTNVPTGT